MVFDFDSGDGAAMKGIAKTANTEEKKTEANVNAFLDKHPAK